MKIQIYFLCLKWSNKKQQTKSKNKTEKKTQKQKDIEMYWMSIMLGKPIRKKKKKGSNISVQFLIKGLFLCRHWTSLKAVYDAGNLMSHACKNIFSVCGFCSNWLMFTSFANGDLMFQVARWFFNGDLQSLSIGCRLRQTWGCSWRCNNKDPHIVSRINLIE